MEPEPGVQRTWSAEHSTFRKRTAVVREDRVERPGDLDVISRPIDAVGVNYYRRHHVRHLREHRHPYQPRWRQHRSGQHRGPVRAGYCHYGHAQQRYRRDRAGDRIHHLPGQHRQH